MYQYSWELPLPRPNLVCRASRWPATSVAYKWGDSYTARSAAVPSQPLFKPFINKSYSSRLRVPSSQISSRSRYNYEIVRMLTFEEAMNAVSAYEENTFIKFVFVKKRRYGTFSVLFISADCCLLVFERNSIRAARALLLPCHTLQYEVFILFSTYSLNRAYTMNQCM